MWLSRSHIVQQRNTKPRPEEAMERGALKGELRRLPLRQLDKGQGQTLCSKATATEQPREAKRSDEEAEQVAGAGKELLQDRSSGRGGPRQSAA